MKTYQKFFRGLSISTGVIRYHDLAYLLATEDDLVEQGIPHTRIFTLDRGELGAVDLQWMACSASAVRFPDERFIAISQEGFVRIMGGGENREEARIGHGKDSPQKRGSLREVRGIGNGMAYAVGLCRQAYRRESPDEWVCFDKTASSKTKGIEITDTSFESIDGFDEQEIYVVGWEGEIWRWDGNKWEQMPSPTNVGLHKVKCSSDGFVYACGKMGTILRGRGDNWEIVEQGMTEEDFWGLEYFKGKMYVSSLNLIYSIAEDSLELADFGEDMPTSCYHLSSVDEIMWSIGAKDVLQFDGKSWSRIVG